MSADANLVWNGKKYHLPFVKINGYVEISGSGISTHGSMGGVNISLTNGRLFINNVDVERYIIEKKLPELKKVKEIEHEFGLDIKDEDKEDAFEREILSKGIQTHLKCPHCGQNALKSIGGMINKCSMCGYKKIGGAIA